MSDLIAGHKKLNSSEVKSKNSPSFSSLQALTSHHLSKSGSPTFSLNKGLFSVNKKKDDKPSLSNLKQTDSILTTVTKDVSSLTLREEQNTNADKKNIQINNDMKLVVKKTNVLNLEDSGKSKNSHSLNSQNTGKNRITLDSNTLNSSNVHKKKIEIVFKKASPLGKVLCRRWKTKTPFTKNKAWYFQTSPHITRYDFSELSPDSKILQYLRKKV